MPDKERKGKLNEIQKEFILRCLACGFGYQETVDFVKDEFGISITRQNVKYYADNYPQRIKDLHEELSENIEQIPFANKMTRVAHLDRVARKLLNRKNWPEFRAVLRQIAEETGGIVQKHEHTITHEDALAELE
jgi:hypothetical protein